MQRWRGTELAKFQVPTKSPAACKKQWQRFHAKVLDATMASLPDYASSDFVAELSELMSDSMWWDAVEAKHVELLHDQASNGAGVSPKPLWLLNNPEFIPDSAPLGRDRSTPEINQAAAAAGANRILTQSQPESAPRHSHISTTFIAAAFRPPLLPTPPLPLPPSTFAAIVAAAVATATVVAPSTATLAAAIWMPQLVLRGVGASMQKARALSDCCVTLVLSGECVCGTYISGSLFF